MYWLVLILSLPSQNTALRMRIWRGLKSAGAGVLRDGVYILPERDGHESALRQQAQRVQDADGRAYLLRDQIPDAAEADLIKLFDRTDEYKEWNHKIRGLIDALDGMDEPAARRGEAQLRRDLENIVRIDFFPESHLDSNFETHLPAARQTLRNIGRAINARFSPDEPNPIDTDILIHAMDSFNGCLWATRKNLWIDRVASAWLIKRFIDPDAEFIWFTEPGEIPDQAIGFDYDGADFSHVQELVTFEVLLRSFELSSNPALEKIGDLVHYLDVGGMPMPEAAGLITLFAGARDVHDADDDFLTAASAILDNLYAGYDTHKRP